MGAVDGGGVTIASSDLSGFGELKAVLRIRAFRRLWAVLGLSSLGDWLGLLAASTFAASQVSNSTAQGVAFGSVIAVRLLPALVLGPVAGVFADRFDRRLTMVACDLVRFLFFASIPAVALVLDDSALIIAWTAIATFVIETVAMIWTPAKEAAVPNLLPRARLETANQLTLATTYGVTPVLAALVMIGLEALVVAVFGAENRPRGIEPSSVALWFNALTFLATALTVFFGIKEISGRRTAGVERKPGMLKEFTQGWSFVSRTPLVRGLVLGIFGAFAGGGVVVGTARFYAVSLSAGDAAFALLFAVLFLGLGVGIAAGPRLVGALSRRRWFGLSIILAAGSVLILAVATHLSVAVGGALLVGVGAGMAFLSGTTLLGGEVADDMRGRAFAFVQMGTRVVLMLSISLSSVIVGAGGSRQLNLGFAEFEVSSTRPLLAIAGVFGVIAGIIAFRQMDDKQGVPLLADVLGSIRGRPLSAGEPKAPVGLFIVFEGGEGAGKSTQVRRLAEALQKIGRDVVVTREPGATPLGSRIRSLVLDPPAVTGEVVTPRAEALLYAADRAHHVASIVRPALARGAVVVSDRYVDSSLAYQGAGRILPVDEISWLSKWATGGLKPDLVVLLDLDPTIGLARAGRRGDADRLESESLAFHERVRYAFLDLASDDPSRYLVLEASRPVDALAAGVLQRVRHLMPAEAEFDLEAAIEEVLEDTAETVTTLTGDELTDVDPDRTTDPDLTDTASTGADLTGADLTDADLTGADLTGTDLTGSALASTEPEAPTPTTPTPTNPTPPTPAPPKAGPATTSPIETGPAIAISATTSPIETGPAIAISATTESVEAGPAAGSPVKPGPPKASRATASPATVGPATVGPATVGPVEAGSVKAGPAEAGPAEAGPAEAGPATVGPVEAGPAEAGPVKASRATAAPAKASPVKTTPVKASPVKTTPVKASPVKTTPVKASPVKASPRKASRATAGPVTAGPVAADSVEASSATTSSTKARPAKARSTNGRSPRAGLVDSESTNADPMSSEPAKVVPTDAGSPPAGPEDGGSTDALPADAVPADAVPVKGGSAARGSAYAALMDAVLATTPLTDAELQDAAPADVETGAGLSRGDLTDISNAVDGGRETRV